jgi:HAMP domain-containing protein
MKIKNKLLFIILFLAVIPAIAISLVFYTIGVETLNEQIKISHYKAVSAVDTLIFIVVSDMVNIAFTAAPKIADLIKKEDYQTIRRELNAIDQINDPDIGTGRGLGYQIAITTDEKGNILARSNIVEGVEKEISQKGHIFYLDEEKIKKWDYPENFGIGFNNALKGRSDARKIIYDKEFLKREGYGHLVDRYRFNEMMGLTAFQPIFNQEKKQIGIIILVTILNNNHAAIGAINAITGAEFTAITPEGEIMASFFVNPPIPNLEIIEKAKKRAEEMVQGVKEVKGKDTVFYTKERIYLRTCPGGIITFKGEDIGTCYLNGKVIPFENLEEKVYRFNFISEVDPDLKYVSIRGIAYDLTDYDYLIIAQTRYFIISFLIAFLIILLVSLITAKKIALPIIKCTQAIEKIEKEGFGGKIEIKTGDEVETLVTAFNNMSEKLAQNYKELEEQKNVLEVRVQAKTKELRELANSLDMQIKEKTKDLQNRIDELERFHKITIDREIKMVELKKEIAELKEKLRQYGGS